MTKQILSLGAGIQSSALLLMSCRGVLPKLDAAIFADTQWEPQVVYEHLEWLKLEAEAAGIPLVTVTKGNLRQHTVEGFVRGSKGDGQRYATLPLRVMNQDGTDGMVRRQCTREYKIEPIERWIKAELLGLKKGARWPTEHVVDQWMGISTDEMRRARMSDKAWRVFVYPLLGLPDRLLPGRGHMNRSGCVEWLRDNYPGRDMPRSSCIGCPFHTNAEWRQVRSNPAEWADVVEVDEAIRHADGMDGTVYLHRSLRPLAEADIGHDPEQGTFEFAEECLGYCGS